MVCLLAERYGTKSNVKFAQLFNPSFKHPMCLATLRSCDTTKQSVDDNIYIYIYIYIYHSNLQIAKLHPLQDWAFPFMQLDGFSNLLELTFW